jgi:hypothetical protein
MHRARAIGKERAQWRFVASSGVSKSPPPECEIHPLGMKQSQPVFDQCRIGAVVVQFASMQAEVSLRIASQCSAHIQCEDFQNPFDDQLTLPANSHRAHSDFTPVLDYLIKAMQQK